MAGHNKWSKVKHIKAVVDAKKGKVFSKIARELTIAAKNGGREPDMNPRLRSAISAAKAANMPGDNVDRAIKKGLGELEGASMEEITYEGYAPGGVAMLIECVTDNKNRSSSDVRTAFNKGGGTMGSAGSVAHLFHRKGEIKLPAAAASEDAVLEAALDAGADDVVSDEEEHTIYAAPDRLYAVSGGLKERGLNAASIKLVYVPGTVITLTDVNVARQVLRLYDHLDDLDDTQNVSANFEITDEVLEQLNV
jgi:YebC/PmpR family DNA-binding regulatory protein